METVLPLENASHRESSACIGKKSHTIWVIRAIMILTTYRQPIDADLEENALPIMIAIETHTPDQYLTTAYQTPTHLSPDPHFVSSHAQFAVDGGDKALLVSLALSKPLLAIFMGVMMVLGIGVGVLVGLLTKRADIGLLVGTAAATALGCVETALFWLLK